MVRSCLLNWIYTTACPGTTWAYLMLSIIPSDHSQIDAFLTLPLLASSLQPLACVPQLRPSHCCEHGSSSSEPAELAHLEMEAHTHPVSQASISWPSYLPNFLSKPEASALASGKPISFALPPTHCEQHTHPRTQSRHWETQTRPYFLLLHCHASELVG